MSCCLVVCLKVCFKFASLFSVTELPIPPSQQTQPVAAGAALHPPPSGTNKRKLNASGSRKTSTVWLEFNILSDEPEPIAACKHCHKRCRCDPNTHGTSNMLAHSK